MFGSSPRTWGTQRPAGVEGRLGRFIPTHVGNTSEPDTRDATSTVHPHARGEHILYGADARYTAGSSPRTWGTRGLGRGLSGRERFIPTHVGNTPTAPRPAHTRSVHPHARGEHRRYEAGGNETDGSSPRTWGTPPRRHRTSPMARFIPTHVGNTLATGASFTESTVHPHARGEHKRIGGATRLNNGSSPRTWGTRARLQADGRRSRFIPTHVGNTQDSLYSR